MRAAHRTRGESRAGYSKVYRYTAVAIVVWTIIIGGLLAWGISGENKEAIELATKEARTTFNKDLAFRTWVASHGGVYVPPDERTPPNPYLSNVPERDITTTTGQTLTLMNPAYVMRQVMEDYENLYGVKGHITSLKPLNPVNAPDEWERQALLAFEQGATETSEVIDIDGLPHVRYMQPLIAEEACLQCHGEQGYKVGDIRGGVSVAVPMTAYLAIAREDINTQIWTHGILFFFGLAGIGFVSIRSRHHITERGQSEEELRFQGEILRNMTEGIQVTRTGDQVIVYTNPNFEEMFGYGQGELLGKHVSVLNASNEQTPQEVAEEIIKSLEEVGKWYGEVHNIKKNGATFWCQASVSTFEHPAHGTVWVAVHQDITERIKLEKEIKKFKTISDSAEHGASITSLEGELIYINKAYAQMHGYKPDELIGKPFSFVYNKEQLKYVEKLRNRLLQTGTYFTEEIWRTQKKGTVFPTLTTSTIVKDDNGKPLYIASTLMDITERKRGEQEIEKFKTIADNAVYGISIGDLEGKLVYVNKSYAEMHGYTPDELIGKRYTTVYPDGQLEFMAERRKRIIETGQSMIDDVWRKRKDGTIFPALVTGSLVKDDKGKPLFIAATHIDITERKKMQEQLMVTDRLASIGELASGIAHELNNPLTGVIGLSELVLARKDLPDGVKGDLEIVNREARRTANIVKNLLTFARKHPEEKQPMDINKAIAAVLELRAYEQKVSNIEVGTRFAPDLSEITADSFQLQQVFLNIVINAEHFMTEAHGRGTLTITTERLKSMVRISFADDGPGISGENIGHLFDPFFTTKDVGKGTGLGLSISYGIITEHSGRIYAESEPGKGATFIVELPASRK